jgi:hypothetical protein
MKRFIAAVSALAALSFATPAQAEDNPVKILVTRIMETGTAVVFDKHAICKDKDAMGMYKYEPKVVDQLVICVANHKGDYAELADTILHESVHVVQACKGGSIYGHAAVMAEASMKETNFVASEYPADEFVTEMEARVIASQMNYQLVINLVEKFCFE